MTRVAILLAGCALLVGCNPEPAPTKPAPTPTASATPIPVVFANGWVEFWPNPANSIDVLNNTGARLGKYQAKGAGYRADAEPTLVDLKITDKPNTIHIVAAGSKTQLDALTYTLDVQQPDQGAHAAKSLGEMIVNSFRVLGLDGAKQAAAALNAGKDASGTLKGADYAVTRTALPGGKPDTYRLTVTFNRTGANRPANS